MLQLMRCSLLVSALAAGFSPDVSTALTAWCVIARMFGVLICFVFPVQEPVHHLDSCAMRIWPGVPAGHPWVRQRGRGSAWSSSGSINGGRVCSGVFGEIISGDVTSDFFMRCLLGVCNVVFCANFVISSGSAGHSSSICTGDISLIRGAGGSMIVGLRR